MCAVNLFTTHTVDIFCFYFFTVFFVSIVVTYSVRYGDYLTAAALPFQANDMIDSIAYIRLQI